MFPLYSRPSSLLRSIRVKVHIADKVKFKASTLPSICPMPPCFIPKIVDLWIMWGGLSADHATCGAYACRMVSTNASQAPASQPASVPIGPAAPKGPPVGLPSAQSRLAPCGSLLRKKNFRAPAVSPKYFVLKTFHGTPWSYTDNLDITVLSSRIICYWPTDWEVNRHTTRCTSPISVVLQCKLVSG